MVIADEWPGNAPELSVAVYGVPRVLPSPSHVIFPKSCEVEKTAVAPVFMGDPAADMGPRGKWQSQNRRQG